MALLDIGEVARRSGMAPSALRYYEAKGLIAASGRHGLRRLFDGAVLERLALIALGRASGFTLDEIGAMFTQEGKLNIDRALLLAKADDLDRTIRRLTALRDGLRHAARCQAPNHLECPTFQRILHAAAAGALGPQPQHGGGRPPSRQGAHS
ncbi:DNA-binding transcriptional MerR regulator [Pseudoduganella flava]|uniref:DNA-binding transcriptional MerR regulator n=1 Tax=Pseudoduganella flava TaxID=871742 RepID=A0A562PLR9_9BURK|nr:helix-turn-helix domain-containing protein [Pseudoduganella flava]QGZ40946.1 MerR family transcriptional regulator [Pseudoduganella flava]TWI45374.1 DNA-binding transcriptional MerR regulator [Pseudoduganella flava]